MHETLTGSFCWTELAVDDLERAVEFYGRVFPWKEAVPVPGAILGSYFEYSMLSTPDGEIGGAYELLNEQRAAGVLPHWLAFISVESADRIAERAAELGGSVVVPPTEVLELGRMVVLEDPDGARIAAWEPRKHAGFQTARAPGFPFWLELVSSDPERAIGFLTELFGWTPNTLDLGTGPYTLLTNGETPVAGISSASAQAEAPPPGWLVYFGVTDLDAALKTIIGRGGKQLSPAGEIPEIGRFASAADPQGACFALIEPA